MFFIHAWPRWHPELLTHMGNISSLVTFCKCHRIALSSVPTNRAPFFTCVIHLCDPAVYRRVTGRIQNVLDSL
jgi:hypothetical protein